MLNYGELFMIHELHRQGLSIRAIARRTGLARKTVRKYLRRGLEPPSYGPRARRASRLDPYRDYLAGRVAAFPELSARRLLREIRALGYTGGYSILTAYLRGVRPPREAGGYEHRFETPPARQAQVDFAHFRVSFTDEPGQPHVVWLFSMVLGHSRYLYARYHAQANLESLLRGHIGAFTAFAGVPAQILYDRMKCAVLGEDAAGQVRFNRRLLDLASHYGFTPKACAPYRAKTKGKVERPFRYLRQDFFLGRSFRNLDDLNAQLAEWLATVANRRRHGTTGCLIDEAFATEHPHLAALPALPFTSLLRVERRISRDGMVSVNGNAYSVPDTTRRRVVEVHTLAEEIRIYEAGRLIAVHTPAEGRGHQRILAGHRRSPPPGHARTQRLEVAPALGLPGEAVASRSLELYERIGRALATHREAAP